MSDAVREAAEAVIAERRRDVTPRTGYAFWGALDRLEAALAATTLDPGEAE